MSGFIKWLESLSEKDTRVRAVLRRSLAFDPGAFVPAYPYVEPFLGKEDGRWRRAVFYLVAGLWASHWREGRTGPPLSVGSACAAYQAQSRSASTERRLVTLLDADADQLPTRMRQVVALLREQNIDFDGLLKGLLNWNDDQKRTQNLWARDFYRNLPSETSSEHANDKEATE